MAKKSYTFGETPEKVILAALEKMKKPYLFSAPNGSADALLIERMVNIGIDSKLEAITSSKFSREPEEIKGFGGRLRCEFSPKDMLVLLRRLWEDGGDDAWLMRSDMLSTLDIEEI